MECRVPTVLVEGDSDAVAVKVLARRLGLPAPRVVPVGGSRGIGRMVARLTGEQLVGLVDAAERNDFESVIARVFVCDPDLESELIRALGIEGVEAVIAEQGELGSFRRLQRQPFQRQQNAGQQLTRFLGGRSGNKARYARLLAEALPLDKIPTPLGGLLASLAE